MIKTTAIAFFLLILASQSHAQCEAYYRINGDLSDSSGDGLGGTMIGIPGQRSRLIAVMTSHGDDENAFWNELSASIRDAYGLD